MKSFSSKVLIIIFSIFFSGVNSFAQEELKNFRFGLKVTPMLTWFRPDGKVVEKDGVRAKFGYGLMTEFRLNKVISFATGIGGDYEGGKLIFKDSATYFVHDGGFIPISDTTGKSKVAKYLLNSREYNINYITIPITLKMKTNDIGGMTYYGLFGADLGIRTKSKVTDKVTSVNVPQGVNFDPTGIENTKDMNILRMCLDVGVGIEYNLSGSTSFLAGLNYRRGFMSAPKKESEYLLKGQSSTPFEMEVFGDSFQLTLGVLF